jgi:hypothetical protein
LGSNPAHRWIEGGKEARTQKRERFGGGTDGKEPREHLVAAAESRHRMALDERRCFLRLKVRSGCTTMMQPLAPDHH